MERVTCIKALMKEKKLKNYLEIGVSNGHVLFRIKSNFKIAVDPTFFFDNARKFGKTLLNPYNLFNQYYSKTSDDFFLEDAPKLFARKKIGISLIDGMHEYAFALRDVENTLKYLDENGVIIMHDCNPKTKEDACSFEEWKARDYKGAWNGDVWKVILHLRSLRNDLNAFVLDCDHGLGIITINKNEKPLSFSKKEIADFSFEDLAANRKEWLNLKPAEFFYEYFGLK
jgi:hypothetical protein